MSNPREISVRRNPKSQCKQLYEEEILELAAKEGARPQAEGKGRRIGRIKRLYEDRLKAFTHEKAGRDGDMKIMQTAHEKKFYDEERRRRKLLVGMKRISPALRTTLHLMKLGCLATRDKAPKRGRNKQAEEEEMDSMCRRCGGEEETIEHLVKCKKNSNTAGRLLRALREFGSGQALESLVNLTMEDKEPDKTRALTIIAASLAEELVKGNGRVKWKGWLHKLERVAEGQAGRSKTS